MKRWWFKPKRYGYGAAPSSWEGLIATALCALAIIADFAAVELWLPGRRLAAVAIAAVILVGFCWLAWSRTEGGWRWRWGDDD